MKEAFVAVTAAAIFCREYLENHLVGHVDVVAA